MPGVKLTTQAYCKMVLHGAKYPHCAVNGLLVAERQRPRKEHPPGAGSHTLFVDCIPLFHGTLALTPMLEVALTLVSSGPRRGSGLGQVRRPSRNERLPPTPTPRVGSAASSRGFVELAKTLSVVYVLQTSARGRETSGSLRSSRPAWST